jgi:hypothetical protein
MLRLESGILCGWWRGGIRLERCVVGLRRGLRSGNLVMLIDVKCDLMRTRHVQFSDGGSLLGSCGNLSVGSSSRIGLALLPLLGL